MPPSRSSCTFAVTSTDVSTTVGGKTATAAWSTTDSALLSTCGTSYKLKMIAYCSTAAATNAPATTAGATVAGTATTAGAANTTGVPAGASAGLSTMSAAAALTAAAAPWLF